MPPSSLDRHAYTVGWICALPKEMTAAVAMLDDTHNDLDQPPSDHNSYTLGRIGKSNVVIACLPSGEIGTNPAASVATRMLATFPCLNIGLMVGIGGGVPSHDHDIRLGDVVVSMPADRYGGVVQHDLGKTLKDGQWLRMGFLNGPPAILRTTISKLMSLHQVQGHKIQEHLSEMGRKHPNLSKDFTRHTALVDILFESEPSDHEGFNDWVKILREPRPPDRPIEVHYGLIASGNQVIKSGRRRDQLSKELGGVLCFEMEAAGLMNVFPCVVIRGICDYADAHKQHQWQEYAAAVAAAYAKELINTLPNTTAVPMPAMPGASTAPSVVKSEIFSKYPQRFLPPAERNANCRSYHGFFAPYDEQSCLTFPEPHVLLPLSRNKGFVGRESEMERLEHGLYSEDACQRVAIVGLGGVGKTQIALELAYRKREDTPDLSIFWVPATQPAAFEQAYQRIYENLQIPRITEDITDIKQLVKENLSKDSIGSWLLIIDNADDSKMLYERDAEDSTTLALIDYLPFSRRGSIVFTTRSRKIAVKLAGSNVTQVGLMEPGDAKEILRGCLLDKDFVSDTEAATKLLDLLGYLPLAIVQAAAYMNENDISIKDYTDLYNGSEKEIIDILSDGFEDQGRYRDGQNSIAKTWLISFNQIQRQTPLAIEYLSIMACLLNQDIPQSILPQASTKKQFMKAVGTLTAYSLLVRIEDRKTFEIHSLVHLATRNWLRNTGQMAIWADKTVERLAEIIPAGGYQDRDIWTAYLPHASHLLRSQDLEFREQKFITLSDHLGRCLYSNGRYGEAEQVHRQTLDLRIQARGAEDPDTLMSSACLAEALSHQGKYAEAEKLHRETLAIRKRTLGIEHPDVMNSMQYLAQALVGAGAYSEGEEIHRTTRDLRVRVLHLEHRSTLTSMSYLAEVLNQQGKYEEAEKMHLQTLDTRIRLFGLDFPATLASMSCLGVTQRNRKNYEAAELTQREVLRLRIKVLGERHPHTLITKRWLADVLQHQTKHEEAGEILQEVLDIQSQLLGEKHPDTMHTLSNLAETTCSQGRLTQAKSLYEEVYNLRKEVLGPAHPDTLHSMSSLATFLHVSTRGFGKGQRDA